MRFAVDGWDPGYGSTFDLDGELDAAAAEVDPTVERAVADWGPVRARTAVAGPERILFVDGVRRIEARAWIDDPVDLLAPGAAASTASEAIFASYAAGVVCCSESRARVDHVGVRRGLFTVAARAESVPTSAGPYTFHRAEHRPGQPMAAALSRALQNELAEVEREVATGARAGAGADVDDLLVVDGPLSGRRVLPRTIGYIKSHHSAYLTPDLHAQVGRLGAGERTPVFRIGHGWDRYSWYLRLPGAAGAPWAGIVRIECAPDRPDAVIELATLSQAVLPRFASAAYKDTRAPQNLYPIAGLERELRRRLGDPQLLYRALRVAAAG
ncbi:DNA double-strand break repair nuclease NurA [Nakamurella sp.]|uniref:DNA double-strand break repair nuclease NurA n=1 Tax=Nakamurella sp. TaxID=1869182 RepID=UPI003B3B5977